MPSRHTTFLLRFGSLGIFAIVTLFSSNLHAQVRDRLRLCPKPDYVMPCAGKTGTSFEMTIRGDHLGKIEGLLFSHPGIKAELAAEKKEPVDPIKGGTKKSTPSETVRRFKVVIAPNTPFGMHDVRVVGFGGMSLSKTFIVSDIKELSEEEVNDDIPEAQKLTINSAITGVLLEKDDVDYYQFEGKEGQRIIFSCLAYSIDSRAEPHIQVLDSQGRLLGSNHSHSVTDALLDVILPRDDQYFVRVCSLNYSSGGYDHTYRLKVSTTPWIDAVHPCVLEPGKANKVTVYGCNLPGGKLDPSVRSGGRVLEQVVTTIQTPNDLTRLQRLDFERPIKPASAHMDGMTFRLKNASGLSNPVLLTYATETVVLENRNNDSEDKAQTLKPGCEVAGLLEKTSDEDWYSFAGKRGDVYFVELFGERLGNPVDLVMQLKQGKTKRILAELDDQTSLVDRQFYVPNNDPPALRFVVPQDGDYRLCVKNKTTGVAGGPRMGYRLRISRGKPDFRLVVMPTKPASWASCRLRQRGRQFLNVFVIRRDGWDGEIELKADGLPPGVSCPPQVVSRGVTHAQLVLSMDANAKNWSGTIKILGTGQIDGRKVVREARNAVVTYPLDNPGYVLPARLGRGVGLALRKDVPFTINARVQPNITIEQGRFFRFSIEQRRMWAEVTRTTIQLTPSQLPIGITARSFRLSPNRRANDLRIQTRSDTAPGKYTVVYKGVTTYSILDPNNRRRRLNRQAIQATQPINFLVLPKKLANPRVTPTTLVVKAGQKNKFRIKLNRLYGHNEPFQVSLVLPNGVKNISAKPVTIPGDKDVGELTVQAAPATRPVFRRNLTIRFETVFHKKYPITQDIRCNINVVK
ncbi:MAG: hypothetical protein ACFCD0_00845 [Gemmataceae bacterium]